MIEAKLEKTEIEKLQRFFNATQKQTQKASSYALSDVIKHLKTQLYKGTANQAPRIQQKPLTEETSSGSSRLHISSFNEIKRTGTARLWFGTYKISLARLNPKQVGKARKQGKNLKAGVKAGIRGSIFRQGAFLMPIRKKTGDAVVPYQVMKRAGKKRLPIIKQTYNYKERAVKIEKELIKQVPDQLANALKYRLIQQLGKN